MNTSHNGISFALTEEQRMLQQLAWDFARTEIAPVAEHYDRTAEFPSPVIQKARAAGLINMNIPAEYGGGGASLIEECLVGEALAWGCSGISTSMMINNLAAIPVIVAGSEAQKKEWLGRMVQQGQLAAYAVTEPAAGSDVAGIQTTAVQRGDEYVLKGSKTFISNASHSDFFIVFAYTDKAKKYKGLSAFIVERSRPGFSVSKKFDKLGQRASDTAEITLDGVAVPASQRLGREGDGFLIAMQVFDRSRPAVAAAAVGVAQRALDESLKYARERQAFGMPLVEHQAIGYMLADMAMNIEAARLLAWRAAWLVDQGQPNTKFAAFAKAFAADAAMKITTDAVQIFGGYGFMKEYPVEKLMRDCKVFQIYEGTSQIQRNIIARELARG
ncbi:MAG: putative acyl-CoA dehydrogenase short-chain specific [Anaerolineales bacterium]|nr:putative acyl-CoA dehydrogenase short-chain specific [Anaerolineales bacterium]